MEPGRTATIRIRPGEPSDRAFILDSAWRSICEHPTVGRDANATIRRLFTPVFDAWRTTVAVDPGYPNVIYAWLCVNSPESVAWGFTQPQHRRRGLMRALAAEACVAREFEILFPPTKRFERWKPRWRPYLVLGSDHAP